MAVFSNEAVAQDVKMLEEQLDSFDEVVRIAALTALCRHVAERSVRPPAPQPVANLHAHTFFSYNAYGYPTSRGWPVSAACRWLASWISMYWTVSTSF